MHTTQHRLETPDKLRVPEHRNECTIIKNARLCIREFNLADAPALQQMHADSRVTALLIDDGGVPLNDATNAARFIHSAVQLYQQYEGYGIWAVDALLAPDASGPHSPEHGARTEFCGFFALMPVNELPGDVEIGIRLKPSTWGSGLSFEGTRLLLGYAFDQLQLSEVWAFCDPRNRSARANNEAQGADWIRDAAYQDRLASHYLLSRSVFETTRHESRQQRMRAVLRRRAINEAATGSL